MIQFPQQRCHQPHLPSLTQRPARIDLDQTSSHSSILAPDRKAPHKSPKAALIRVEENTHSARAVMPAGTKERCVTYVVRVENILSTSGINCITHCVVKHGNYTSPANITQLSAQFSALTTADSSLHIRRRARMKLKTGADKLNLPGCQGAMSELRTGGVRRNGDRRWSWRSSGDRRCRRTECNRRTGWTAIGFSL